MHSSFVHANRGFAAGRQWRADPMEHFVVIGAIVRGCAADSGLDHPNHHNQAVLADMKDKQVDQVFCLGDLVGYGPWPNEVIDLLRQRSIPCVQGNYDESVGEELMACGCDFADAEAARLGEIPLNWTIDATTEENKAWLRELPQSLTTDLGAYKINVATSELAEKYQFLSSPTIRVNGRDIQLEITENTCESCGDLCGTEVDCRTWSYQGVDYDVLPKALIIDAILREVYGGSTNAPTPKAFVMPENLKRFYGALQE